VILAGWPEGGAGRCFQCMAVADGPAVALGGRGSTGPGGFLSAGGMGSCWSAWREGVETVDRSGDLGSPGPGRGDTQPQAAAAADQAPGGGEQAQPQALGFPAAGLAGEGEHLHPGQQFAGHGDDLAPDLVLGVAVQGKVAQAGVLSRADAVLATGPAAVAQFQIGKLAAFGAGGKAG
jgi:hypothetical protein